jgi:hypothetical protein
MQDALEKALKVSHFSDFMKPVNWQPQTLHHQAQIVAFIPVTEVLEKLRDQPPLR